MALNHGKQHVSSVMEANSASKKQWLETAKDDQTKENQILDELIVTKDTAELWASIERDSYLSKSF